MKIFRMALVRKILFKGFKSAFALFPIKGTITAVWNKQLFPENAAPKILCGDGSTDLRSGCDENVNCRETSSFHRAAQLETLRTRHACQRYPPSARTYQGCGSRSACFNDRSGMDLYARNGSSDRHSHSPFS
jgi:hypothetical protein